MRNVRLVRLRREREPSWYIKWKKAEIVLVGKDFDLDEIAVNPLIIRLIIYFI